MRGKCLKSLIYILVSILLCVEDGTLQKFEKIHKSVFVIK